MGFGTRWTPHNEKGKDSPPPGSYYIPTTLDTKGPRIVKASPFSATQYKHSTPGPGTYDALPTLGRDSPKYTFHGTTLVKKISQSPAPGFYSPKTTVTEFSGFREISFGVGERNFLRKSLNNVPGPGSYEIAGTFDRFKSLNK